MKKSMNRYLILLVVFTLPLSAKEVSSEKLRFKIIFPDAAGWSPPDHQERGAEVQSWSVENQSAAQILNFTVIAAPMPEAKPTFKENAEEWAQGMMTRFSRKISSRFAKLAGRDAYELVASVKNAEGELFFSNWMMQVGETTYGVTIIVKDRSKLTNEAATSFLNSIEIKK